MASIHLQKDHEYIEGDKIKKMNIYYLFLDDRNEQTLLYITNSSDVEKIDKYFKDNSY